MSDAAAAIDSKQSMVCSVLPRAREAGLRIVPEFEARRVVESADEVAVQRRMGDGSDVTFRGGILVLGAGAIGNSRLLLHIGFQSRLPMLGHNFYTHPQYMCLGIYDEPVNAHRGPLQSYKSADPSFRRRRLQARERVRRTGRRSPCWCRTSAWRI